MALGTNITKAHAKEMLDENKSIWANIDAEAKAGSSQQEKDKISSFLNRPNNAFVISKELIERLFDEGGADCLAICPGAHATQSTVDGTTYEAGSFTIVAIGCMYNGGSLKIVDLAEPAIEYSNKVNIAL